MKNIDRVLVAERAKQLAGVTWRGIEISVDVSFSWNDYEVKQLSFRQHFKSKKMILTMNTDDLNRFFRQISYQLCFKLIIFQNRLYATKIGFLCKYLEGFSWHIGI